MQAIDAGDHLRNFAALVALGLVERLRWCVDELVGQPLGQGFYNTGRIIAARQQFHRVLQFVEACPFGRFAQGADGRHRLARIQPVQKTTDPIINDGLGFQNGCLARLSMMSLMVAVVRYSGAGPVQELLRSENTPPRITKRKVRMYVLLLKE